MIIETKRNEDHQNRMHAPRNNNEKIRFQAVEFSLRLVAFS